MPAWDGRSSVHGSCKQPGHLSELALRNEGGKRLLNPDRRRAVLGVESPNHGPGVSLVIEHRVDGALEPLLSSWGWRRPQR